MAENFSSLVNDINLQTKEAQWTPNGVHNSIAENWKQRKNIESTQKKNNYYLEGTMIQTTVNFSSETMEARMKWNNL